MRSLLDHDVPHALRWHLSEEHEVVTAQYQGWAGVDDDELLAAAEEEFGALVTLDTNLVHQQNVGSRKLGLVMTDVLVTDVRWLPLGLGILLVTWIFVAQFLRRGHEAREDAGEPAFAEA